MLLLERQFGADVSIENSFYYFSIFIIIYLFILSIY